MIADGSVKSTPIVIRELKNPRNIKYIKYLPATYLENRKECMICDISTALLINERANP